MKKTARSSRIGLRLDGEKRLLTWWLLQRWQCARLLIKLAARTDNSVSYSRRAPATASVSIRRTVRVVSRLNA